MGRADELEAELEVVRLEEKLAKAKDTKAGASQELKAGGPRGAAGVP